MNQPYNKKTIVISGINLFLGGTLTILHDCLTYLEHSSAICKEFIVVTFVHNRKEFERYKNIQIVEYHKSRQSWFYRLYYEYVHFRKLSRRMNVHLWFSLHDITPNVIAEKRAVYCHNPAPFYKVNSVLHSLIVMKCKGGRNGAGNCIGTMVCCIGIEGLENDELRMK